MKAAGFMIFGKEDGNGAWEAYGEKLRKKVGQGAVGKSGRGW
jgi:hypothetical protein